MKSNPKPLSHQTITRRTLLVSAISLALLPAVHADYASEVQSENPLVYYRFNDSVTTTDLPGPAVNIGSLGATGNGAYSGTFLSGVAGAIAGNTALSLTQTNATSIDFTGGVNIPNNPALNPSETGTNPFTVECWVKPNTNTSTLLSPVNSMSFTTGRAGFLIYQNGPAWQLRLGYTGSTTASILDGGVVTQGQWQHLAATYTGGTSGTMTLYVNGVSVGSAVVATYEANTNAPFVIGATSAPNRTFDGTVDEVAFYNSQLSPTIISSRVSVRTNDPANYQTTVLADSPAGYWRLGEAPFVPRTPPVAANTGGSLGAGGNGGYYAGAKNSTTGPSAASGFPGFAANNPALSLPDANGYVSAGQSLLNNLSAYTVMGWVKRGAVHSTRGGYFGQNDVLEFGDAASGASIEAYTPSSGSLTTAYTAADNAWQFIALTANGSSTILYINGAEVARYDGAVANYGSSIYNFNVGGGGIFAPTGDFFRGEIDEVTMFDRGLSPGRIQQLYDTALGNVAPGIVGNLPTVTPTGDVPEGKSYTLNVEATGTPPFTYQWKLNGVNIPGATGKTYTVSAAQLNSPNPASPFSYSVVVTNTTSATSDPLDVFVTPVLRWTSASATNTGKWAINSLSPSPLNWESFTSQTPSAYSDSFAVLFDDSATITTVEVVEDVAPKSIDFNNPTKTYTLTGASAVLPGFPGSATKDGNGTVLIQNDLFDVNTLQVNAGKIQFGNGTTGELSSFAAVKVTGGEIALMPPADATYSNVSTFTGGQITFLGSGNLAVTGALSGAGSELFDRNGTVLNTNANSLSGTTTINSGIVAFDGNQEANRLPAFKPVTVNSGATMEIRGVNALPTALNSVNPSLNQATLRVVSGGSTAVGETGTSHAHLHNLALNASSVVLSYSGQGGAYNGESFQLNGDIDVSGSVQSTIAFDGSANTGNAGIAMSATAPNLTHVFAVPNVAVGSDLKITAELENSDSATSGDAIISKTGVGTLQLDGGITHTFSGTTQINEGTLLANGSIVGPVLIAAGAFLDPGPTYVTFGTGALNLQGTYSCEINGTSSDRVIANGNVTFGPTAKITLTMVGAGATAAYYEILSVAGTISGPTPMVTNIPAGYSLAVSGSSIAIVQSTLNKQPMIASTPPTGSENFNTNGGGFSISAPVSSQTDWTYSNGSWRSNGQASGGNGPDNTSNLNSPIYTVTQAGTIQLTFSHRYSFEADYDGGDVQVSVNGAAFTPVLGTSFSQNGYNGTVPAGVTHSLKGMEGFVGNSAGHPAFITSICTVATAAAGDTIQVRFVSASDDNTVGDLTPAGWEIDSFDITNALPSLMTLTWPIGSMQYSDNLQPPWTDLPGSSPLLIDTKAAPKRFFRLKP